MANPRNGLPPLIIALGNLERITAGPGGLVPLFDHEPSTWLRDQVEDLRTRWEAGNTFACGHVVTGTAGVTFTALWRRDTVTCSPCAAVFRRPTDQACDRCEQPRDELRGLAHQVNGLVVLFALCPGCHRREVPA